MTKQQYFAVKRISDNTYYNYIHKDFLPLHQNTKLYKTRYNAEQSFADVLRASWCNHYKYNNEYTRKEYYEKCKNDLKVVVLELREV